jgi:hypothetical protein
MVGKFRAVSGVWFVVMIFTILAEAALVEAQQSSPQPPAEPAPSQASPAEPQAQPQAGSQQSGSQETSQEEEPTGERKAKPREYRNWTFNVAGGANLASGTTQKYVRGGGGVAAVGVARNYSKYFGFRLDFQWDNLPLRASALQLAQAPGASSHLYSFTLDPIINIPVTKVWGAYVLFGPGYYHRSGSLNSSSAIPGSACNGFYAWWGTCFDGSLPLNGKFLSPSLNELGYDLGSGITRKIRSHMDLYTEFRFLHGSRSGITTDLRPITIGVRW